jgi:hypothetical protein
MVLIDMRKPQDVESADLPKVQPDAEEIEAGKEQTGTTVLPQGQPAVSVEEFLESMAAVTRHSTAKLWRFTGGKPFTKTQKGVREGIMFVPPDEAGFQDISNFHTFMYRGTGVFWKVEGTRGAQAYEWLVPADRMEQLFAEELAAIDQPEPPPPPRSRKRASSKLGKFFAHRLPQTRSAVVRLWNLSKGQPFTTSVARGDKACFIPVRRLGLTRDDAVFPILRQGIGLLWKKDAETLTNRIYHWIVGEEALRHFLAEEFEEAERESPEPLETTPLPDALTQDANVTTPSASPTGSSLLAKFEAASKLASRFKKADPRILQEAVTIYRLERDADREALLEVLRSHDPEIVDAAIELANRA